MIDEEQFSVLPFVGDDDPNRAAEVVVATKVVPGPFALSLNVSIRVQAVAWAGPGEPSFSDIQWLDHIRSELRENWGAGHD